MTVGETVLSVVCLTGSDQNKTKHMKKGQREHVLCGVYVRVCLFYF